VISIIFQAVQKHHGEHWASEVSQLKEMIHYLSALYISQIVLLGR